MFAKLNICILFFYSLIALMPAAHAMNIEYEYGISLKASTTVYNIVISRREKSSLDNFFPLYELNFNKNILKKKNYAADALGDLFEQAHCQALASNNSGIAAQCSIPGIGKIQMSQEKGYFWDQQINSPLSTYALSLHADKDLHIQALASTSLALHAPKTYIKGALKTNYLKTDTIIINKGAAQFKQLEGAGVFRNLSFVKLDQDAAVGIRNFYNFKKIEGASLHITQTNEIFKNNKESEIALELIEIALLEKAQFINNGVINAKESKIYRHNTENAGRWASDKMWLLGKDFYNKNELIARKELTAHASWKNEGSTTSSGVVTIGDESKLVPISFINYGSWAHKGNVFIRMHDGTINFTNKKNGIIRWENSVITSDVADFFVSNYGTWSLIETTGNTSVDLGNHAGVFQLINSKITLNCFLNDKKAKILLSPESEIDVGDSIGYNYGLFEGGWLRTAGKDGLHRGIRNAAVMRIKGISGTSDLTNFGYLSIEGTKDSPALIDVKRLLNGWCEKEKKKKINLVLRHARFGANNQEIINYNDASIESEGLFARTQGIFNNDGIWHHTGDLSLGRSVLHNHKTGTIVWNKGVWRTDIESFEPKIEYLKRQISYWHGQEKAEAIMSERARNIPQRIIYKNEGAFVFNEIVGHANVRLVNQDVVNIVGKSALWIDAFENAPQAQVVLSSGSLTFHEQENFGLFKADKLQISQKSEFLNDGTVALNTISGDGCFRNGGQCTLECTQQKPAFLCVNKFENGYAEAKNKRKERIEQAFHAARRAAPSPHLQGANIKLGYSSRVSNLKNGQIDTRENFSQMGKYSSFTNSGVWNHQGNAEFGPGTLLRNGETGQMEFKGSFSQESGEIDNKGSWSVREGGLDLNQTDLKNSGSMFWPYGDLSFSPKNKPFKNRGNWVLGMDSKQELSVVNDGTLKLDHGLIKFSRLDNNKSLIFAGGCQSVRRLRNKGTMSFVHQDWTISESPPPKSSSPYYYNQSGHLQVQRFDDKGTIEAGRGHTLVIDHPQMPNNLQVDKGVKLSPGSSPNLDKLVKIGSISFCTKYGLELDNKYLDENIIYVEKIYKSSFISYKVKAPVAHPHAPDGVFSGLIYIGSDGDFFEQSGLDEHDLKKYGPRILQKLADLEHIRTAIPALALSYADNLVTPQDYVFNNINLLELVINGHFILNYKLHAGAIKLKIYGDFSLGKNNEVMGSLAATDGALSVEALGIDARFGQIYGRGPTKLKAIAPNGTINCGHPKDRPRNASDAAKKLGVASSYTTVVGDKFVYTNIQDINGAFISSGDTLDLEAGLSIDLSYAQVMSLAKARFNARENIDAERAIIHGGADASWKAKKIRLARASRQQLYIGWMSSGYPNEHGWAAKSDATEYTNTGSIYFDTPELILQACSISAYGDVSLKDNGQYINIKDDENPELKAAHSLPSTLKIEDYFMSNGGNHVYNRYYFYTKIFSPEEVSFENDNISISGMINARKMSFKAKVDLVFKNSSVARIKVTLKPVLIDVTAVAQAAAAQGGFFTLTNNKSVGPKFPMGKPFEFLPHQTLTLVDAINPPFSTPLRYLDPMESMTPHMWNIFLQQIAADNLGTIRFKQGKNDTMLEFFLRNNENLRQKINKDWVTQEELESFSGTFLVRKFTKGEKGSELHTYLSASKDQINEFQSSGDFSGDKYKAKSGRDQHHVNTRVKMDKSAKFKVGGDLLRETTKYTVIDTENHTTTTEERAMPQQSFDAPKVCISVYGAYNNIGTHTSTDKLREDVKGKTSKKPLLLTKTTTKSSSSTNILSSHERTEYTCLSTHLPTSEVVDEGHSKSDAGIHLEGAGIHAQKYTFKAPSLVVDAATAQNSHRSHAESSNGISSTEVNSQEDWPTITPSALDIKEIVFDCPSTKIKGSDIFATKIDASGAKEGFEVHPAMARGNYSHTCEQTSPLAGANFGARGWYDVLRASQIIAEELILSSEPNAVNILDTVFSNSDLKIIGDYIEQVTEPQSHHESWSHQHQVIPAPVVQVLAMAIAYYTGGLGAFVGNSVAGIGSIGAVALKAGVQALCANFAASLASHGDVLRASEDVVAPNNLKAIGAAMVSAGALDKLSSALDVNMAPGQSDVIGNVKKFALSNAVRGAANVACGLEKPSEALGSALKQTALEVGAALVASEIGANVEAEPLKIAAHAGLGAGISAITGGNPLEGAAAAALGEFLALKNIDVKALQEDAQAEGCNFQECSGLYAQKLQEKFEHIRIFSSLVIALAGGDPIKADFIVSNALEHNFALSNSFKSEEDTSGPLLKAQQEERMAFVELIEELLLEKTEQISKSSSMQEKVNALWHMFKEDWQDGAEHYQNLDYIKIISSLAIPGAHAAAIVHEGKEIYRGNQSFGGAAFDIAIGVVGGKIVIGVAKHTAKGAHYVWQSLKDLSRKLRHRWYDRQTAKIVSRREMQAQEIVHHQQINATPTQKITRADFSISGLKEFEGHLEMINSKKAQINVGYLEGDNLNIRRVIEALKTMAQRHGANELEIRAIIINKRLKKTLINYFGCIPNSWTWRDYFRYHPNNLPAKFYDRMVIKLD